ncbi:MAG: hypothetical protein WA840_19600, partial [Caulobacteraceae bacterium]
MSDRETYRGDRGHDDRDWRDRPEDRLRSESRYRDQERSFRDPQRHSRDEGRGGAGSDAYGYGDGGYSSYGQIAQGSSDRVEGGYSGGAAGGFGQQGLNSQWGQGGYGPLTQGLNYSQGGGRFGPTGYGQPDYNYDTRSDHHDHSYRRWRDAQLDNHDRDYAHWRSEQARRYDEDYGSWRKDRHAAFSQEFEGWRANRGTASADASKHAPSPHPGTTGSAHGANPA